MKQLVKKLLCTVAPQWTTALLSARARAYAHRVVAGWGCGPLNRKLIERFGPQVQEGPFAGLTLPPIACAEQLGPYLLGVYESELDAAWETVFRGTYTQIIDIGAKFGYYAVGLAKRYPAARVLAFDTDWWARKAVRETAAVNAVGNVEVKGFCSPEWLVRNLQEPALVIADCEGYEAVLFGADVLERLRSTTLVIETHDCLVAGVSEKLRTAFSATHRVHVFGDGKHRRDSTRVLDFLTPAERLLAVQEVRPPQVWLLCEPARQPHVIGT